MEIIKLNHITQENLIFSNIAPSSLSEWDASITYAAGDKVKVSFESDGVTPLPQVQEYEALASSSGLYPPDNPSEWGYLGVSNKYKMFDEFVYSQTVEPGGVIEVHIDANKTNKLSILNILATEVEFSHLVDVELLTNGDCSTDSFIKETGWVYNSGGWYDSDGSQTEEAKLYQEIGIIDVWYEVTFNITSYSSGSIAPYVGGNKGDFVSSTGTFTQIVKAGSENNFAGLIASADFVGSVDDISVKKVPVYEKVTTAMLEASSWYSYFFSDYVYVTECFFSYPKYISNSIVRLKIKNDTGDAKCGFCGIGDSINFGYTQFDVRISMLDYSKKETDEWGQTYLKQGNYSRELALELWIENSQIDAIRRVFEQVRGTACIFNCNNSGLSDFQSLIVYGFYKEFTVNIPGPVVSKCSIDIQGLV